MEPLDGPEPSPASGTMSVDTPATHYDVKVKLSEWALNRPSGAMWHPLDLAPPDRTSFWTPPSKVPPAYLVQLGVRGDVW